ncbi:MAG: FtsX-like permease family protein, partial [Candidatus Diapherotrites archaeon]|nr:FtsX-like permease family protein [Candidatus Diapherotrites archaeon]
AEAALLGATGGLIGSIFGIMIAAGVSVVATASGFPLPIAINPLAFIGAIAFAMAVGMLSGYYPARRAALLEPVAALRYAE